MTDSIHNSSTVSAPQIRLVRQLRALQVFVIHSFIHSTVAQVMANSVLKASFMLKSIWVRNVLSQLWLIQEIPFSVMLDFFVIFTISHTMICCLNVSLNYIYYVLAVCIRVRTIPEIHPIPNSIAFLRCRYPIPIPDTRDVKRLSNIQLSN